MALARQTKSMRARDGAWRAMFIAAALIVTICGAWNADVVRAQTADAPAQAQIPAQAEPQPSGTEVPAAKPPIADRTPRDQYLFPTELAAAVRKGSAAIERLAKSVERVRENNDQLETLRSEINAVQDVAGQAEGALLPHIAAVDRLIAGLGNKPTAAEPAETPAIAAERAGLELTRRQLQDDLKRTRLTQIRTKELISEIQSLRLKNLKRNLRQKHSSPLSAAHWRQFRKELPQFDRQVATVAENWWANARNKVHWLLLILAAGGSLWWAISSKGKSEIRSWLRVPLEGGPPAYLARVRMAVRTLPLLLAPGLTTAAFLYLALWACGLFNDQVDGLALAALKAVALYLVTSALAKTILLPWEPSWRLIGLPTTIARRYLWLTRLLAGVYCMDMWLNEAFAALHVPESIGVAAGLVTNIAFAALLFAFAWLPTHDAPSDREGAPETATDGTGGRHRVSAKLMRQAIYVLRVPATLAVLVIASATMLGYFALGRFVAGQVMLTGIGAAVLMLGHLVARSLTSQTSADPPQLDGTREKRLTRNARRRQQTFGFLAFLLNVTLTVGVIVVLLLSWGISEAELTSRAKSLLFGFEVGKFKFSLLQILIAIVLFAAMIVLTRWLQAWLSRKLLSTETMDRGIANSIHSGIGYAGVALAGLVGVSYAGLDLSNIALIASALSIGIGFGLNAIASNFVSGLIMLIERPIKVGDWVVVGAHEGYVRHISVRATEIETFDRASVIIPNSDFMTSAVQNWTHRNAMGRVIVNIGTSYDADPAHVMAILSDVAAKCDNLLKYPAPSVHFEEFGASSLDFSIRAYVADVNTRLTAKTALRLGISDAFRREGIEIPYPQQDVHLRDLDGVRELVGQAMTRRAEAHMKSAQTDASMPHGNDNGGDKSDRG